MDLIDNHNVINKMNYYLPRQILVPLTFYWQIFKIGSQPRKVQSKE